MGCVYSVNTTSDYGIKGANMDSDDKAFLGLFFVIGMIVVSLVINSAIKSSMIADLIKEGHDPIASYCAIKGGNTDRMCAKLVEEVTALLNDIDL